MGLLDNSQQQQQQAPGAGYLNSPQEFDKMLQSLPSSGKAMAQAGDSKPAEAIPSLAELNMAGEKNLRSLPPGVLNREMLQGFLAGQQNNRENMASTDAHQLKQTALVDWKDNKTIEYGMKNAAETGGYFGVIDYLRVADPSKAILFEKAKLSLDADMMQNDLYKTLLPIKKAQALAEGYGALGKMGTAILNAKPEDRQNMYELMLPIVKGINPNASDKLDDKAAGMFMLGIAQSTPENILYQNKLQKAEFKSKVGKGLSDLMQATQLFGPDSPQVQVLRQSLGTSLTSAQLSNDTATQNLMLKAGNNDQGNEAVLRKEYSAASKTFNTVQDYYNRIQGVRQALIDPKTSNYGPSDLVLVFSFMKVLDPDTGVKEGEQALARNAAGIPEGIRAQYNSLLRGGQLTPAARAEFLKTTDQIFDSAKTSQQQNVDNYRGLAVRYNLNPENVIMNQDSTLIQQQKQINQMADEQIKKYKDHPDAITQINEMRKNSLTQAADMFNKKEQEVDELFKQYK